MVRMGCVGSYLGANHTLKAQSPGWPGACLTARAGGAGQHRPPNRAQFTEVTLAQPSAQVNAQGRTSL